MSSDAAGPRHVWFGGDVACDIQPSFSEEVYETSVTACTNSVNVVEEFVPLMYLTIVINESIKIRALIDTGAQRSLIHESVLVGHRMSEIDTAKRSRILAIGETSGILSLGSSNVNIKCDGIQLCNLDCVVVPGSVNMNNNVILGMDFISINKLIVNTRQRTITKNFNDGSACDWILNDSGSCQRALLRKIPCVLAQNTELEGNDEITIPVAFDSKCFVNSVATSMSESLFLYETKPQKGTIKDLVFHSGIVHVDNMRVLVANKSDSGRKLKKGAIVGVLSTVAVVSAEELPKGCWTREELEKEVQLGEQLWPDQKETIWQMIFSCSSILSTGSSDVGKASVTAHTIRLHDDTPIYQRPRRFPEPISAELEKQCQELYQQDIIEPSVSAWSSPVVPVRKKDGSIRLCVDYRKLNNVTKPDRSPIPSLNEAVYGLHGAKFFTTLDCVQGFHQIPLSEESKECTAFSTERSHWQFKRLGFGLRNAPAAFQREIQTVLQEFPQKRVIVYIDDILIIEDSFEKHLELVRKVLHTLAKYGIKIKPGKCQWFASAVDFLGHRVSSSGLKKQQAFMEKVDAIPLPVTVGELREFLGLINFQRKFLKDASIIQKPLSELTGGKQKAKVEWTKERLEAFERLKSLMKEDIELTFPCYAEDAPKMELWVDASACGAGACLQQAQEGEDRIISYASMTFNQSQRNYSTLDRELAALRWAVKTFRSFLYGIEFIIKTDHRPLVYLHNMRLVDARLARTLEDLSDFNFSIEYIPGKSNVVADALSRMSTPEPDMEDSTDTLPEGLVLDGPPIPGGGDSLFLSLLRCMKSQELLECPATVVELRKILVEELLKTPEKYGLSGTRYNWRRELRLMLHSQQVPCLEVLLAASFLYHLKVHVYFWSADPIVFVDSRTEGPTTVIHIQCVGGIHFNSLRESGRQCSTVPILEIYQVRAAPSVNVEKKKDDLDITRLHCGTYGASTHPQIAMEYAGHSFCGILDTGAEVSLMSYSICEKFQQVQDLQKEQQCYINIEGFSGLMGKTDGTVDVELQLPADFISFVHKFYIVKDDLIPHCVLLGMDFLSTHGLAIDGATNSCMQDLPSSRGRVNLLHTEGVATWKVSCAHSAPERGESESVVDGVVEESLALIVDIDLVRRLQQTSELSSLLEHVKSVPVGEWPQQYHPFRSAHKKLVVRNKVVYHEDGVTVPVVTPDLIIETALTSHHNMAHIGRDKLVHLLRRHMWHPRLYTICNDVCTSCHHCQVMKVSRQCVVPPTLKITTAFPFEMIAVDLIQFCRSRAGYIGCLVMIDHNSKWVSVVPIRNKQSIMVASAMEHIILPSLLCLPHRILSDNKQEFVGEPFEDLLRRYNIKHIYSTPYKPSSNGCVERMNRTLTEMLRNVEETLDWRESLSRVVITYNNTKHRELGISPAEYLLVKKHPVRDCIIVAEEDSERWKEGHPRFLPFAVGQTVMRKMPKRGHSTDNKFKPRYEGPYKVEKVNKNGLTYEIEKEGKVIKVHHTQLMGWTVPPPYLEKWLIEKEAEEERKIAAESPVRGSHIRVPMLVSSETDSEDSRQLSSFMSDEDRLGNEGGSLRHRNADVEKSFCHHSFAERPGCGEQNSFIFPAVGVLHKERNYYQLCQVDGSYLSKTCQTDNCSEECGVVLTAQDETWDVSSIEDPGRLGLGPLHGDQPEGEDICEESGRRLGSCGTGGDGTMAAAWKEAEEAIAGMVSQVGSDSGSANERESTEEGWFGGFSGVDRRVAGRVQKLRSIMEGEQLKKLGDSHTSNRPATRSQGPVAEYPYVQKYSIERIVSDQNK